MKSSKIRILTLALLTILCVSGWIFAGLSYVKAVTSDQVVLPAMDLSAKSGTPTVDSSLGYSEIYQDGMSYSIHICGVVKVEDNTTSLFFTNDDSNEVLLRLEIIDENGEIIGETGLIKPGEYLEKVTLTQTPDNGENLKLRIIGYEADTYYSAGNVILNTTAVV